MPDQAALLAKVRNYLDITWVDTALDAKLADIILRGIAYLDRIAGQAQTYLPGSPEHGLLMNYCLYERSNSLDVFQKNYLHELNALMMDAEVNRYVPGT